MVEKGEQSTKNFANFGVDASTPSAHNIQDYCSYIYKGLVDK